MRVLGSGAFLTAGLRPEPGRVGPGLPFPAPATARPEAAPGIAGTVALASLDAVLALQEVVDDAERRRRALRRGDDLLNRLGELHIALLEGSLPAATLRRLRRALGQPAEHPAEPGLAAVLGEIEQRVAVELAKLERAGRCG